MSMDVFRLELTEQERTVNDDALGYAIEFAQERRWHDAKTPEERFEWDVVELAFVDLRNKLRALEPVGTEGGL